MTLFTPFSSRQKRQPTLEGDWKAVSLLGMTALKWTLRSGIEVGDSIMFKYCPPEPSPNSDCMIIGYGYGKLWNTMASHYCAGTSAAGATDCLCKKQKV